MEEALVKVTGPALLITGCEILGMTLPFLRLNFLLYKDGVRANTYHDFFFFSAMTFSYSIGED